MKNLKKMLSVIVVIAMLATTMIPAFAADTAAAPKTDAEIAKGLGVVIGGNDGITEDYLKATTQRYQSAIIFLRLLGLEATAKDFDASKDNFTDAKLLAADMQKYLGYLKANPQYGWIGSGNGKFDPTSATSAQAFYKVLLEGLGYKCTVGDVKGDFDYADTITFAASKGLTKVASVTKFTNADLITAVLEALPLEKNGTGKTLLKTIVESGAIKEEIAKEFMPDALELPKTVTTAVYSVTATNGQLTVVMSEDVGETPTAADFAVTQAINGGAATTVTATVYGYTYATKTAVIDVPVVTATDAEQSIVYGVSYKGGTVVNAAPVVVAGTLKVDSAAYANAGQFTVKFTAPVDKDSATNKDNYTMDNGITIAALSLADDKKTVTITTSSTTPLVNGTTYNVTVSTGVKSAAGVALKESATKSFSGSDASIPAVLSVVAKGNTAVKITFSEPIKVGLDAHANYKINSNAIALPANVITVSPDNTSVEISANLTAENTLELIAGNTFVDYAGNKVLAGSYKFNVVAPTAVTQATSATLVNQNTVTVAFDNLVKILEGTNLSANFYWNTTGVEGYKQYLADSTNTVTKVDDKTFKVNFTSTSNYIQAGTVYFFVCDLVDYYGNNVPAKKFALTVAADSTAVLTKSEAVSEKSIELTFDKALNTDTINTTNVTMKDSSGTAVTLDSVTYNPTDKKVVLAFPTQSGGDYNVTISGLKTTTGNVVPTATIKVTITDKTAISSISVNPVDAGATGDYAIIKFPESMATTGSFSIGDKSKYTVDVNGTAYAALASADTLTVVDDKTVKIVFTGNKLNDAATNAAASPVLNGGNADTLNVKVTLVADKAGNINGSAVTGSADAVGSSTDNLDISSIAAGKVKITDLKTIKVIIPRLLNAISLSDFIINNVTDSTTIPPAQVTYSNEADGTGTSTITLTVSSDLDTTKTYAVSTIDRAATAVVAATKDASDLLLLDNKTTPVAVSYIAPKIKKVSLKDSTHAIVEFDKTMNMVIASDFKAIDGTNTYVATGVGATVDNTGSATINSTQGTVYVLTFGSTISASSTISTVDAPQSEDTVANKLPKTTGVAIADFKVTSVSLTNNGTASTAENGDSIVIKFSEKVKAADIKTGFTGAETTVTDLVEFNSNDTITFAGTTLGTINLGAAGAVTADSSTDATIALSSDGLTLTIKFTEAPAATVVPSAFTSVNFVPDNALKSDAGAYADTGYVVYTATKF